MRNKLIVNDRVFYVCECETTTNNQASSFSNQKKNIKIVKTLINCLVQFSRRLEDNKDETKEKNIFLIEGKRNSK